MNKLSNRTMEEILIKYYLIAMKLDWNRIELNPRCMKILDIFKENKVLDVFNNAKPVLLAHKLREIELDANTTEFSDFTKEEIVHIAYSIYSTSNLDWLLKFNH